MPSLTKNISDNFLKDLQANILKGHGRSGCSFVFFNFENTNISSLKSKLKQFTSTHLTSAFQQRAATEIFKKNKAQSISTAAAPTIGLYLSKLGYEKLGFNNEKKLPLSDRWFNSQMQSNHGNWNFENEGKWQNEFSATNFDGMISVAHDSQTEVNNFIENEIANGPFLNNWHIETGKRYKRNGRAIEHFGFYDGLNQPSFFAANGNLILDSKTGKAKAENYLTHEKGSYLVFMKFEQHLQAYKSRIEAVANKLNLTKKQVEAQVVGRHKKSGLPLTTVENEQPKPPNFNFGYQQFNYSYPKTGLQKFNYEKDTDGLKCPFHAHIRKVNQRKNGTEPKIIRRGITYGERTIVNNQFNDKDTAKDVGLLFLSFQKDIKNNFIPMLSTSNNRNLPGKNVRVAGIDPLIGITKSPQTQYWSKLWGAPPLKEDHHSTYRTAFQDVTTMRGGEFLYAPPITFFVNL